MKAMFFEAQLIAVRPDSYEPNRLFTDRVMSRISKSEILSTQIRKTSVNKKETLFMRIRHLPKLAIVAIAISVLLFLTGTAYAVVQTVNHLSKVTVKDSGTNEFGREQLNVTFNSCDVQKDEGTTYELKRGSNLSSEDGAKVLQAMCDMDVITTWIQNDAGSKEKMGGTDTALIRLGSTLSVADTVKAIQGKKLTLERGEKALPENVRVIENNKEVPLESVKPGDTVIYFLPAQYKGFSSSDNEADTDGAIVFKLPLETKYYSLDYRSYVNVRSACDNNPERECLKSNGINQTILIVTMGGTLPVMNDTRVSKNVQGKVISYDAGSIKLDVGDGVTYTIQTPRNIVDEYNRTKVYSLASFDNIYANTNPEDLKIKPGDSLDIYYLEAIGESASVLSWNQVGTIGLMVERTPKDLSVLQKY